MTDKKETELTEDHSDASFIGGGYTQHLSDEEFKPQSQESKVIQFSKSDEEILKESLEIFEEGKVKDVWGYYQIQGDWDGFVEKVKEVIALTSKKCEKENKRKFPNEYTDYGNLRFEQGQKAERENIFNLVSAKVLMNWKGQNEFIDWFKKEVLKE